jgi:hypothetical protein
MWACPRQRARVARGRRSADPRRGDCARRAVDVLEGGGHTLEKQDRALGRADWVLLGDLLEFRQRLAHADDRGLRLPAEGAATEAGPKRPRRAGGGGRDALARGRQRLANVVRGDPLRLSRPCSHSRRHYRAPRWPSTAKRPLVRSAWSRTRVRVRSSRSALGVGAQPWPRRWRGLGEFCDLGQRGRRELELLGRERPFEGR